MWRVTEVRYNDNREMPSLPWCRVTFNNGDDSQTVVFNYLPRRRGPMRWVIMGALHGDITNSPKELKKAIREFYPVLRIMNG